MRDNDYLYRPPAPLSRRRLSRVPAWGWALILLCIAVTLQLFAATFLILAFGPKSNDNPPLCQSNLRKLGAAISLYAQDYDGTYPLAQNWMDAVQSVEQDDAVFKCPLVQQSDIFAYGYSFNSSLAQLKHSAFSNPALVALDFDSARTRRNANDAVTSLPDPPRHRGISPGRPGMSWGNNIGYVDGHVALVPLQFKDDRR